MNALTQTNSQAVAPTSASSYALLMDNASLERMERIADLMASGRTTTPAHLRSKGDCFAIVLQSMQWGMNPIAVAQKTFLINGVLGYEAQLVAAVINTSGAVAGRFHFEWFGPWEKIIGKFKEVESRTKKDDNGNAKKYIVPAWNQTDENGLGVKVWATIKGEQAPRELTLLLTQARTRNSTLWTEDPKQQIAYLAQKRWARLYTPDVILGVYTTDEIEQPSEKFMGMAEDLAPAAPSTPGPAYTPEQFAQLLPSWRTAIAARKTTADGVIGKIKTKGTLTAEQEAAIRAPIEQPPPQNTHAEPVTDVRPKGEPEAMAEKTVGERMHNAATLDALFEAADLIGEVADPEARARLTQYFEERKFALESE